MTAKEQGLPHPIALQSVFESARCLGVAEAKGDTAAIAHWQAESDRYLLAAAKAHAALASDTGERGVVGLADIGEAIRTEDNAGTSHPVFVVEQQQTVWAIDTDYDNDGFEWLDADGPVEPRKRDRLERLHQAGGDTGDYRRLGYKNYWEFVTACFTRKGCEDYLRQNGHNLKSPRIYVHSGWRNDEWQRLRAALRAQPAGGGEST